MNILQQLEKWASENGVRSYTIEADSVLDGNGILVTLTHEHGETYAPSLVASLSEILAISTLEIFIKKSNEDGYNMSYSDDPDAALTLEETIKLALEGFDKKIWTKPVKTDYLEFEGDEYES